MSVKARNSVAREQRLSLAGGAVTSREHLLVELVDETGTAIGACSVAEAHTAPGRRHRAFSVLLYDRTGRVLLQRRATVKTPLRLPLVQHLLRTPRARPGHHHSCRPATVRRTRTHPRSHHPARRGRRIPVSRGRPWLRARRTRMGSHSRRDPNQRYPHAGRSRGIRLCLGRTRPAARRDHYPPRRLHAMAPRRAELRLQRPVGVGKQVTQGAATATVKALAYR